MITEGFAIAHKKIIELLDQFKKTVSVERDLLIEVARTSLRTKLQLTLADHIAECIVDAILAIRRDDEDNDPDLHMIEIQVNNFDHIFTKNYV